MLALLLARFGINDDSLLCLDEKPGVLGSGHADGIQPRTLEVFQSLGLAHEILADGCWIVEVAFWNPTTAKADIERGQTIERTAVVPDITVPTRFPFELTLHQGRIERILEEDMLRYSKRGITRSSRVIDAQIDEEGDPEFPVLVQIESEGVKRMVRTKHLVGADGAHSVVRQSLGLQLEGESTDYIWGVVDLVVKSNFPDIRRRTLIHSPSGSLMVIPREQIATGQYLTRLYVQLTDTVKCGRDTNGVNGQNVANGHSSTNGHTEANGHNGASGANRASMENGTRSQRERVTLEDILNRTRNIIKPYYIEPANDDAIDWWTAYQVGQRMTKTFMVKDSKGVQRAFIVGDACHTHTPKAGQGMNISMMDSYNLAWKLAYSVNGLSAAGSSSNPDPLLETYDIERRAIIQQLLDFDKVFASMFSGSVGAIPGKTDDVDGISHEKFHNAFRTGNGFTSGCGHEYPANLTVDNDSSRNPIEGIDYLSGILRAGRRLLNVRVKQFMDGRPRDLQDNFPSDGKFRILILTSTDLLSNEGNSVTAINSVCSKIIPLFPPIIELVAIHPKLAREFSWNDLPSCLQEHAEMKFHDGNELQDVYSTYGVPVEQGVTVVVRPDGYVGVLAALDDMERVEMYLRAYLRPV